jgi:hypothetical protein
LQILRQEILPPFHSNDDEASPLTMVLHTINEGMYVKVAPYKGSSGGVGVVKKKSRRLRTPEEFAAVFAAIHVNTTMTAVAPAPPSRGYRFDIKYTGVETCLTQDVSPSRVASYSFSTTARKRGRGGETRPSIISPSHQPLAPVTTAVAVAKAGCTLARKQPTDGEKNLALKLYLSLLSCERAARVLASAWGVERQSIYNWKAKADASATMTIARKTCKDAGKTLFNSDMRRDTTYTEAKIGPMRMVAARAKDGESITRAQAARAYKTAPAAFKEETSAIIEDFKGRSAFLKSELERVIARTNGCISWVGLERALNGEGGGGGQSLCRRPRFGASLHPLLGFPTKQRVSSPS